MSLQSRFPHHRATTHLSSAPDEVRPPCAGRWDVYDVITEAKGRLPDDDENVIAARMMCATCLLRMPDVARACLDRNKGERWRAAVLGTNKPGPRKLNAIGDAARGAHERHRAARLADLRHLIATGAQMEEVCARLGVSDKALYKWCRLHGHLDEWQALSPPKVAVVARVDRRTRGEGVVVRNVDRPPMEAAS